MTDFKTITEDELISTRQTLASLISEAYDDEKAVSDPDKGILLLNVVQRVASVIDPADYEAFLRATLFDAVDSYFHPFGQDTAIPPDFAEFLASLRQD